MHTYKLVYVDDDQILATILARQLEQFYDVKSFTDPCEALNYIQGNHTQIDMLITDFKMPALNGLDLIKEVREKTKFIKCVLLTGYSEIAKSENHYTLCDLILQKSILSNTKALTAEINKILPAKG